MKYPMYSSKTVYPQDIECVWQPRNGKGGIYVGNLEASQNLATLKKHGIRAVLTAAKDINLRHPKSQIPHHLHVPGEDHERFDLKRYFDQSIEFIAHTLKQTNILVHCMAGVSRSVTLVLAYLMKYHKMSYQQAFQTVKRKRKIINPNRGFIKQLQQYQRLLQTQTQAMRRSLDSFQTRIPQNSLRKSYYFQNDMKHSSIHYSIKKFNHSQNINGFEQNSSRYLKFNNSPTEQSQQNLKNNIRNKYQVSRINNNKNQTTNFSSFNDLNKELDEKIANIRRKYMEATDLLNRQQKKKGNKYNTRGYFNDLDQTDPTASFREENFMFDPPSLIKATSANTYTKNKNATSSFANYSNPRKTQAYMYYNY